MKQSQGLILCISYCIGLLSTGLFGILNPHPSWWQWLFIVLGLSLLCVLSNLIVHRWIAKGYHKKFWLISGIIALLGVIYIQLRIPQPTAHDISHLLQSSTKSQVVVVTGKALSEGRQTGNQKIQFWLAPQQVTTSILNNRSVDGKLYVTLPLSEKLEIHSNQVIKVQGVLYIPKPNKNPGSFDFKAYLARQGAFTGLKGLKLIETQKPPWGLWKIRQRIVNSFRQGLGESYGLLLGSIVIGRQAVDLPLDIKDAFMQGGLAHVLAASGFHVALLLGIILKLTGSCSPRQQLTIGLFVLIFYVGLTGVQPSIMRATLMGISVLIGSVLDRKIHSLGSLVLAGTLLLLVNPLWIWDLGFQLSFLATFGLIVTMPTLQHWFDFLPPTLATLVTLPLAASVWTFPLLVYTFSIVLTYSILTNIITAPLITLISIGGMLSAAFALIHPILGSTIAFLLYYPLHFLLVIISFFNHLPGSSYALGKLPLAAMLLIYFMMLLIWLNPKVQKHWFLISLFILSLAIFPIVFSRLSLVQMTILDSSKEPIIIIQDRGKVVLINGIEKDTLKYTVIPFLTQQGINQIDFATSLNPVSDWSYLENTISIKNIVDFSQKQNLKLESVQLSLLDPALLQLQFKEQSWLWITTNRSMQTPLAKMIKMTPQVLLWSGKSLDKNWLNRIQPKTAIAVTSYPSSTTQKLLQQKQIRFYWTGKDGAIQWKPQKGFQITSTEIMPPS